MQFRQLNWPGLLCSSTLVVLLILSFTYGMPWWTIRIGEGLGEFRISPFDAGIELFGTAVEVPILFYLNLGAKITILLTAATLLLSSTNAVKKHSARMLDLSYKKPVYMTASIVILGILSKFVLLSTSNIDIPFVGASVLQLSSKGVNISVPIISAFTIAFWLAVLSSALAMAAKVYHLKFIRPLNLEEGNSEITSK